MATVLVVEDTRAYRGMLRRALQLDGHRLLFADDGPDGIKKATTHRPEVVVLDLLTRGAGLETIQALMRAAPGVRIIAVSEAPAGLAEAARNGADRTLHKPFTMHEIRSLVQELTAGP